MRKIWKVIIMQALTGEVAIISLLSIINCTRQSKPILPKSERSEIRNNEKITQLTMQGRCANMDIGKCIQCILFEEDKDIIDGCIGYMASMKNDCLCEAFTRDFDTILNKASNKSIVLMKLKNYCTNKCSSACNKIGSIYRKINFKMDEMELFPDVTELFYVLCKNGGDVTYCDFLVQVCDGNILKSSCSNIEEIISEGKNAEKDSSLYYTLCGPDKN